MKMPKLSPFSKFVAIILFIFIGFLLGVLYEKYTAAYTLSKQPQTVFPPPSITISPTPRDLRRYQSCPPGYVQYGMPLGCITIEHMNYCKTHACPICLSSGTNILTADGEVNVKDIQVGTLVWTVTTKGERILVPVVKIGSTNVPQGHMMIHLVLRDGRNLFASPGHPTTTGTAISDLKIGERYDKSTITDTRYEPYKDAKTYDILPKGTTGFYFANDILVGSTLR